MKRRVKWFNVILLGPVYVFWLAFVAVTSFFVFFLALGAFGLSWTLDWIVTIILTLWMVALNIRMAVRMR